ncbi:tripartite tricarboxylate transporter TctB family protein [Treponema sp. OMZ 840]|uniref:tripartite tricarboxylate transporter TctB family protein n=1 Tax=Treponema sp. OMZ 840 TaxID=244313 RepID=UPI003D8D7DD7
MKQVFNKYKDTITALIIISFASVYYYLSYHIKILEDKFINSTFFPRLLAFFLILLNVCLIIKDLTKKNNKDQTVKANESQVDRGGKIRIVLTISILILYIALIRFIGFPLMTALYIFCQILILTPRKEYSVKRIGIFLFISILSTLILYLTFTRFFTLVLPNGILNF